MDVANALPYYDTATIAAVKSLTVKATGVNLIKLFCSEFTYSFYKLDLFRALREKGYSYKIV